MAVVPLMDTTEARYGETGRIMAELNDWITPWFDYGVPVLGETAARILGHGRQFQGVRGQ